MNIEQAKAIPITKILEKLNRKPVRHSALQSWYHPTWRDERTASLHVHEKNNWWYDFGMGVGGDAIAFVQQHLKASREPYNVPDALRWLHNMLGDTPVIKPVTIFKERVPAHKLKLKNVRPIQHAALIRYLDKRGIPMKIAKTILEEVTAESKDSGKTFFALGLKNENNGYEIRNQLLKSSIGPKAISFIRGQQPKPSGIHIFEGFMDYLSIIAQHDGRQLNEDVIILNSIACLRQATPYIKGYGYEIIRSWLDNDFAGKNASESIRNFAASEENLIFKSMNKLYMPYKDVNECHMAKLGL